MRETKLYKPKAAYFTDKELIFVQKALDAELGDKLFDFVFSKTLMTRHTVQDYDELTYNFSSAVRNNKIGARVYGAGGFSFRMLYEFLCDSFNGGEPFIDTYFKDKFSTRPVYKDFINLYAEISGAIQNEADSFSVPLKNDDTPDMRFNESKRFKNYKVWQNPIIKSECKRVAELIRDDIIRCLSTGAVPIRGKEGSAVSDQTLKRRKALGLDGRYFFYATGQLIKHLNIFVSLDKDDLWQKTEAA